MLDALLEKLNLKQPEKELNEEERATLREWSKILSTKDITIDDLKKFLPIELQRARAEAEKYDNSHDRDLYFKAYCRLLSSISHIITTPAAQREQLREHIRKTFGIEI